MDELNVSGYLTKLNEMFGNAIDNEFHVIGSPHENVDTRVPSKFGYKIKQETIKYKIQEYKDATPLKWGFIGESLRIINERSLEEAEHILPDRELMDNIVNESYKEFDAYIHATLAKMTLMGHTTIFYPVAQNPNDTKFQLKYYWTVDDSCISPKGGCVSHILLHPIFAVAKEEHRSSEPSF